MKKILFILITLFSAYAVYPNGKFIVICSNPEKLSVINSVTHSDDKLCNLNKLKNGYLIKCLNDADISFRADEKVYFTIYNLMTNKAYPRVTARRNNTINLVSCLPEGKSVLKKISEFYQSAHNGVVQTAKPYIPKGKLDLKKGGYLYFDTKQELSIPGLNLAEILEVYVTDSETFAEVFHKTEPPFDNLCKELQESGITEGKNYQLYISFNDRNSEVYELFIFSQKDLDTLKK